MLGPLLFLIYINDITEGVSNHLYLFADDTSMFCPVLNGDIDTAVRRINRDLDLISKWCIKWLVKLSESKSVAMLFSKKRFPSQVGNMKIGESYISVVQSHKHLGIILSHDLNWSLHIDYQLNKCTKVLNMLRRFKLRWSRKALETCYLSFVRPIIEYGDIIYDGVSLADSSKLENLQVVAARIVLGAKKGSSVTAMYQELGWVKLSDRRTVHKLVKIYGAINHITPLYLTDLFDSHRLRGNTVTRTQTCQGFCIPRCRTNFH